MNEPAPFSNRIATFLRSWGYAEAPPPLHVADLTFQLPKVLTQEGDAALVVVLDDWESSPRPEHQLQALALALRRTGSLRPVTAILPATARLNQAELIREWCRVITVAEGQELADALRTLLPLPTTGRIVPPPAVAELDARLEGAASDPFVQRLRRAAKDGPLEVQRVLLAALEAAADPSQREKP